MMECWNNGILGFKAGKSFYKKCQKTFEPIIPSFQNSNIPSGAWAIWAEALNSMDNNAEFRLLQEKCWR
jgi:hypothetical protein